MFLSFELRSKPLKLHSALCLLNRGFDSAKVWGFSSASKPPSTFALMSFDVWFKLPAFPLPMICYVRKT